MPQAGVPQNALQLFACELVRKRQIHDTKFQN